MTQRKTHKRKTMRNKRLRTRKHRSTKKHLVKKHRVKSKRRTRKTKNRPRRGGVKHTYIHPEEREAQKLFFINILEKNNGGFDEASKEFINRIKTLKKPCLLSKEDRLNIFNVIERDILSVVRGGAGDDEKPYPTFEWEFSKSDDYSTKELFDMLHPESKTEFNKSEKGKPDDAKRRWLMTRLFKEQLSDKEVKKYMDDTDKYMVYSEGSNKYNMPYDARMLSLIHI